MNLDQNSIAVEAWKSTGEYGGSFTSYNKACTKLYITCHNGKKVGEHIKSKKKNPVKDKWGTTSYTFKLKSEK